MTSSERKGMRIVHSRPARDIRPPRDADHPSTWTERMKLWSHPARAPLALVASISMVTLAAAQQAPAPAAPPPSSPPVAAQEPATLGEKAERLLDKVTGNPAANADVDMRRVLDAFADLDPKPIEKLSPQEARQQPTPADAVAALLKKEGKDPEALKAQMGVTTQDT